VGKNFGKNILFMNLGRKFMNVEEKTPANLLLVPYNINSLMIFDG